MPGSVNTPRPTLTTDSAEDYFSSAFTEMQSYLEYPAGDAKSPQDPRSPRLTPPIRSPALNGHGSNSPGSLWNHYSNSPGISGYQPIYNLEAEKQNIAALRRSPILSPPNSSEPSPQKFAQPVEISPLDSLLAGFPTESARAAHGQVTPPDDPMQSPNMAPLPIASFPFNITPPERSPANSARNSLSMSPRLQPSASGVSDVMESAQSSRRRRPSTNQSNSGSRKRRKSNTNEEAPDIQEAKRRRFLERNRVAASKCRQKKKQWMQELETEAREAQNASKQLKMAVSMLREEILRLKNELLKHNTCDCTPIRQYLSNEAARLAEGSSALSMDHRRTSTASDISSVADKFEMGSMEDAGDYDMIASPEAV